VVVGGVEGLIAYFADILKTTKLWRWEQFVLSELIYFQTNGFGLSDHARNLILFPIDTKAERVVEEGG